MKKYRVKNLKKVNYGGEFTLVEKWFKNGIENCVAICGTAFSKNHYMKLRRYCDKIYFILDNDDAGIKSSSSIYNKFNKYGTSLKFLRCRISEIKDIDEYFAHNCVSSFKKDFKLINLF